MKESISKIKRYPLEWEKIIFKKKKELISKVYKHLMQLNTRKINPVKKMGQRSNRHFFKEDIKIDNKHMKRCSTSLVMRETKNQNHCEVPSRASQNGCHQKIYKQLFSQQVRRQDTGVVKTTVKPKPYWERRRPTSTSLSLGT